jgi:diacylglycerol kinase family enzyme
MKRVFIVNPVAGKQKGTLIAKKIATSYPDSTILFTCYPGHAKEIAKQYSASNSIVYAVGGDTTASEVLNGLIGGNCTLAIIPCGSGNDYVRNFTDEKDPMVFLKSELETTNVDIGRINVENKKDLYFLNNAVIGIPAEIGERANNVKGRMSPKLKYIRSIPGGIIDYHSPYLHIQIDDICFESRATMLAIGKGGYFGGGFNVFPNTKLDDGKFNVDFTNEIPKIQIPILAILLFMGKHETNSNVSLYHANRVFVEAYRSFLCNVDGATFVGNSFEFNICEQQIPFAKPKCKRK